MKDRIYIGIKGKVVCLDKQSGNEIWRTDLRRTSLVSVAIDGDTVIAYANGHLFALDGVTGEIRWRNPLPGLGHGYCIIAAGGDQTAVTAAQQAQSQAAAVAASTAAIAASSAASSSS